MGYQALESVRVAQDPVDHVAAVAGAQSAFAVLVDKRIGLLRVVQAVHQVDEGLTAPVAVDAVNKLLPIACQAARVDHDDDIAAGGKQFGIPAIRPFIPPLSLWAAVDQELHGIFLLRVKVWRFDEEALNFGPS